MCLSAFLDPVMYLQISKKKKKEYNDTSSLQTKSFTKKELKGLGK